MIDPIIGGLVFAAILGGTTKTGRKAAGHTGRTLGRAAKNAGTSGYAATGWRTPGKALEHHAGRAGAAGGRIFAAAARTIERHAAKRWKDRQDTPPGERPQMVRWLVDKPAKPTTSDNDRAGEPSGPPPSFGQEASPGRAADTAHTSVVHPDPADTPVSGLAPETVKAIKQRFVAELTADKVRENEIFVKPNGDVVLDRRRKSPWAKPMVIGKWTPRTTPRTPDPSSGPATTPTTTTAPTSGAEGSTTTVARFGISLEPPTNDAEFLATLIDIGDAMKAVAEEIEGWAETITGMGLPSSVTTPLHAIPEGITEAAQGAGRAAAAFEDEFEDAREVASRGMKITGRDAA
jgi:hypothetical protein